MMGKYVLKGKIPVECYDLIEWAKQLEKIQTVKKTVNKEGVMVSTVFLGTDHNFSGNGAPILFETMVFGGPFDQEQERYKTWEEAEAGHDDICEKVFGKLE